MVVTTLGGAAWHRPRPARDPKSPFEHTPDLPVALGPLRRLAVTIYPEPRPDAFGPDKLAPLVTAEIGYFGPRPGDGRPGARRLCMSLLGIGLAARRARRPGLVGWLPPGRRVGAVALAVGRREAVPPTTGVVAVLDIVPGSEEAAATGLMAVYRPESGPVELTAVHGGWLDPGRAGLEGQTRRRIQSDVDAWHWEGLALPAGVRSGQFRGVVRPARAGPPVGPAAASGHLAAGSSRGERTVLLTAAGRSRGGSAATGFASRAATAAGRPVPVRRSCRYAAAAAACTAGSWPRPCRPTWTAATCCSPGPMHPTYRSPRAARSGPFNRTCLSPRSNGSARPRASG